MSFCMYQLCYMTCMYVCINVTIWCMLYTDIDECEDGPNNCSTVANCTNTLGSYSCQCYIGYTGDGVNCTGIT